MKVIFVIVLFCAENREREKERINIFLGEFLQNDVTLRHTKDAVKYITFKFFRLHLIPSYVRYQVIRNKLNDCWRVTQVTPANQINRREMFEANK